jgi:hypothetical protein
MIPSSMIPYMQIPWIQINSWILAGQEDAIVQKCSIWNSLWREDIVSQSYSHRCQNCAKSDLFMDNIIEIHVRSGISQVYWCYKICA